MTDKVEPGKSSNPLESGTVLEQFGNVCQWLEKHKLYTTLDALLDEGATLGSPASESSDSTDPIRAKDGAGLFAQKEKQSLENLHAGNVLTFRFANTPEPLCVSASVDRTVKLTNYDKAEVLHSAQGHWAGAIVSLDAHPTNPYLYLCGSMDQTHSLLEFKSNKVDGKVVYSESIQKFKQHKKHVVRVKWSPTGRHFATASYDGSCLLYTQDSATGEWKMANEFSFGKAVETVLFNKDGTQLIAAVREDNYLHYINVETFQEQLINMNATGDNHVSFSAMDLNLSPDGKYVLVSTDRDRLILFATGTAMQARNFYGVPNDQWGSPRAGFSLGQNFIYSTTEDKNVHVLDLSNTKRVHILNGHTNVVRDIHRHPTQELLGSCSYDKTIRLWH